MLFGFALSDIGRGHVDSGYWFTGQDLVEALGMLLERIVVVVEEPFPIARLLAFLDALQEIPVDFLQVDGLFLGLGLGGSGSLAGEEGKAGVAPGAGPETGVA